ncbi:NAD(P)-binding domain-containing protein [Paucibacter sp. R3-3]|uniref:NAD(P)-binding domain-containing protein n=1 Tax=Roseateles agri TaxID=3098619 RepID=A0ABU5DPP3_9BURK|nr:NAD(P)-binding domain-containing protein [Paucibacter sp. R3-3]MDY0747615.1 NAD(P)-binding domain-containing protein [Paucibacter sp. R3-3]
MQPAMIGLGLGLGLGRTGASMVRRLIHQGHERAVHDRRPTTVEAMRKDGAVGAVSLPDLAAKTSQPRAIGLTLPPPVPTPVLSGALYARFSSRGEEDIANQLLSAMRHEFCGHVETNVEGKT